MPDHVGTFTVGVFPDAEWATRGLDALARHEFAPDSISIIAKAAEAVTQLAARPGLAPLSSTELPRLGAALVGGPIVPALQGDDRALEKQGIAGTISRIGFQPHDGVIFERLVEKGGVLVAIHHEPRAADALSVLHSYGAGNAAIGAWHGRL